MPKFALNKLVRDKMVEVFAKESVTCTSHTLSTTEYQQALAAKLQEELAELLEATNHDERIQECADLEEVLNAYKKTYNLNQNDIAAARAEKNNAKGAFEKQLFIESISVPETSTRVIEYCTNNSKKYPRID